jgi:hypothetical protein
MFESVGAGAKRFLFKFGGPLNQARTEIEIFPHSRVRISLSARRQLEIKRWGAQIT